MNISCEKYFSFVLLTDPSNLFYICWKLSWFTYYFVHQILYSSRVYSSQLKTPTQLKRLWVPKFCLNHDGIYRRAKSIILLNTISDNFAGFVKTYLVCMLFRHLNFRLCQSILKVNKDKNKTSQATNCKSNAVSNVQ